MSRLLLIVAGIFILCLSVQGKQPKVSKKVKSSAAKKKSQIAKVAEPVDEIDDPFQEVMKYNQKWSKDLHNDDEEYFKKHVPGQQPQFLWIGCSDSRVPVNAILGMNPGDVFVHRNVANLAPPSDINSMSVIIYAVKVLKIRQIIVAGHYGCGGVKASLSRDDHGVLQSWLSHIRNLKVRYYNDLLHPNPKVNERKLVQLNVQEQVYNIASMPVIQQAWNQGETIRIHGVVYQIQDGTLKNLKVNIDSYDDLPIQRQIFTKTLSPQQL